MSVINVPTSTFSCKSSALLIACIDYLDFAS
jgi:hypothetical protein